MVKAISEWILIAICFAVRCAIWFIAVPTAFADNNRGVSFILQMCSAEAKNQPDFWNAAYKNASVLNAGWLYGNTAAAGCTWSQKFMQLNKPKRVRVHICNCTCFKGRSGRTCGNNECFPGMNTQQAEQEVKANKNQMTPRLRNVINSIINKAVSDYKAAPAGTVKVFAISPCLESGLSKESRKIMMNYVIKTVGNRIPNAIYVDSPLGLRESDCINIPGRKIYCELHGDQVRKTNTGIADNDGVSYEDVAQINYGKKNNKAFMVLAWTWCLNGSPKGASFVAPPKRKQYCTINRDATSFAQFTADNFPNDSLSGVYDRDLTTCAKKNNLPNNAEWEWGLHPTQSKTRWITPRNFPRFKKVWLTKNGATIDTAGGATLVNQSLKRWSYDFSQPLQNYPDQVVLHAIRKDNNKEICWKIPKPRFRPFNKIGVQHIE